jgi:hypothetical protein
MSENAAFQTDLLSRFGDQRRAPCRWWQYHRLMAHGVPVPEPAMNRRGATGVGAAGFAGCSDDLVLQSVTAG